MYGMTPLYMDPKVRTVLMIIGLIVQSIFSLLVLWYFISEEWIDIILVTMIGLKMIWIIDSYILVCSKTPSNKTCHLIFQVLGSITVIISFLLYAYIFIITIGLAYEIYFVFIVIFLLDEISLVFCNISSYKIIQEIKEYNLIPQMNFPYYPSNVRFFNPVMDMCELPPQTSFMPKMLFPFMGNIQVAN